MRSPSNAVPYVDEGNSLQYPGSSCSGTIASAYPWLGPFFAPMPWSPALDSGDKATCEADPVNSRDIYGIKRPLVDNCAIGSAEGDLPPLINRFSRGSIRSGRQDSRADVNVRGLTEALPRAQLTRIHQVCKDDALSFHPEVAQFRVASKRQRCPLPVNVLVENADCGPEHFNQRDHIIPVTNRCIS